jgi:hypothetical protein
MFETLWYVTDLLLMYFGVSGWCLLCPLVCQGCVLDALWGVREVFVVCAFVGQGCVCLRYFGMSGKCV